MGGDDEDDHGYFADREPQEVTCRSCGADDLYWQEVFGPAGTPDFRLYEDGKPHVCKPSADDFDEVPA